MGKGSKRRPVDEESYRNNWKRIFKGRSHGKKDNKRNIIESGISQSESVGEYTDEDRFNEGPIGDRDRSNN